MDVYQVGLLEGFTHQASLIYLNERIDGKMLVEAISAILSPQPGIIFGITAAPVSGLIIRMLGNKAELLYDNLKSIANLLPCNFEKSPF